MGSENVRDTLQLALGQTERSWLSPIGGRLGGRRDKYIPERTADCVFGDSNKLSGGPLWKEPKLDVPILLVPGNRWST